MRICILCVLVACLFATAEPMRRNEELIKRKLSDAFGEFEAPDTKRRKKNAPDKEIIVEFDDSDEEDIYDFEWPEESTEITLLSRATNNPILLQKASELLSLVQEKKHTEIRELFEDEDLSKADRVDLANSYVGNKHIIYYIISESSINKREKIALIRVLLRNSSNPHQPLTRGAQRSVYQHCLIDNAGYRRTIPKICKLF